jgi:hypothetical protein
VRELEKVAAELGGVLPVEQPRARMSVEGFGKLIEPLICKPERRKQGFERVRIGESCHRRSPETFGVGEIDPLCRTISFEVFADAAAAIADCAESDAQRGR